MGFAVLGHGLGATEASALPLSLLLLLLGGGLAGEMALLGRRRAAAEPVVTVEEPASGQGVWRGVGASIGVAGAALVIAAGVLGAPEASFNLVVALVLQVVWGIAALLAIVLGPIWPAIDPLRTIARLLARAAADHGDPDEVELPRWMPLATAVSVLAIGWAQLVLVPGVFGFLVFLAVYALVHLGFASIYGQAWLTRAEAFTAASVVLGRVARAARRQPLRKLAQEEPDAWRDAVASVLIGWGLFDLVIETDWWHAQALGFGVRAVTIGTVTLVLCAVVVHLAVRSSAVARGLAAAVVPLAAGWVAAQYLATVIVDGHAVLVWLSDPFARGWNLLGTAQWSRGDVGIPVEALAALSVIAFALGHGAAAVVSERCAVARYGPSRAGAAQLEFRGVLLVSLCGGTALLLGAV